MRKPTSVSTKFPTPWKLCSPRRMPCPYLARKVRKRHLLKGFPVLMRFPKLFPRLETHFETIPKAPCSCRQPPAKDRLNHEHYRILPEKDFCLKSPHAGIFGRKHLAEGFFGNTYKR